MADAKRKLLIEILSDAKGVKQGFGEAESATGSLGKTLVGAAVAVGAVTVGVDVLKDALGEAVKDEASVSALAQQMKNLGIPEKDQKSAEDFIGKLSLMRGVADDELRPAFAQLVRSTGDVTKAQEQLGLAQDIAAAKGISVAEASDLLAKANNGQTRGLKALGVSLTDANGKALTTEEIFAKLGTTFAGAGDAAANTGAGKLKKMTVGFDEMKEKIGYALLPVMEKLVDFITNTLIPGVEKVGAWLAEHKPVLIAFAVVVGTVLVSAFAAWAASAIAAAAATVAAMLPVLAPIAAVAAAVYLIIDNWDVIVEFFQKLPGRILGFLKELPELLLDLGKKLIGGLLDGIKWYAENVLKKFYIDLPLMILGWMGDVAGWLLDVGKKILGGLLDGIVWYAENVLKKFYIDLPLAILGWLIDVDRWLFDKGVAIIKGLVGGFVDGMSAIVMWFFNLPGELWQLVKDGATWLVDFGKDLVKGIVAGIKAAPGAIRDALIGLVPGGGSTVDKILKYIPFGGAFAEGGLVPGPSGAPRMILAHGGEYVVPNGGRGGGGTVNNITINLSDMDGSKLIAVINRYTQQNGPGWMN